MALTREQLKRRIEAMEKQGASQSDIQEYINSQKKQNAAPSSPATARLLVQPEGTASLRQERKPGILERLAVGAGKGIARGYGRLSQLGEEIISFGRTDNTLGREIMESEKLKPEGTAETLAGFVGEAPFSLTSGFTKEALKRIAEASVVGEKMLSFGRAKNTLGQKIAQSGELKAEGVGEKLGGLAERFVEAYAVGKFIGAPKTAKEAFKQGYAITTGQLTLNDVGQNDKGVAESILDAVPAAIISGGLSAGLFGIFSWLSGGERGLAKQFNKELQPPKKEMSKQFSYGLETTGDEIASVVDDAGNPIYAKKGYDAMAETAKNEITVKSPAAKKLLEQMDNADPTKISRNDIVGDTIDYFDDLYSGELTPGQEKTIIRELRRVPGSMNRVETQQARQSVDALLKDSDFTLKEGQKAFVTETRLLIRKLLNQRLVETATDDAIGNAYTALNRDVSIAYDVRGLALLQKSILELSKISGRSGFWSWLGTTFDNTIFAPQISTRIPGAFKAAAEATPAVVGTSVSEADKLLDK